MYISDIHEDDLEIAIKVVIVGNGAVGKSSMIQRYCRGVFTKGYKKTIGVDFLEKRMRVLSEDVRLMLWDTAGQEEFDAITKAYYRGAQACVVAFSTTDRASFDAVVRWKSKVEDECGGGGVGRLPMVLVQNKIDLMHQAVVTSEEVEALAQRCHMRLYRTSVKEDINICNVFQHLAENYVNQVKSANTIMNQLPLQMRLNDDRGLNGNNRPLLTTTGSTSLIQIGGVQARQQMDMRKISAYSMMPSANSPQEYLSHPMFDSLNHHESSRARIWRTAAEKTIKLKPLTNLTKKRNHLVSLHHSNSKNKLLPIKSGCKVL